jgi:hypothetical protein
MFAILSALMGFLAPFLPQVIKIFQTKQDYAQELLMLEMRLKYATQEHQWKMEEVSAQADIAEMQTLRAPQQSFGVDLLDAAKGWKDTTWGRWLIAPAFAGYAALDILNGLVRPVVTFSIVFFYMTYKWAVYEDTQNILLTWGEQDWGVLMMVLAFYFGNRTAKAIFGGSTQSGHRS